MYLKRDLNFFLLSIYIILGYTLPNVVGFSFIDELYAVLFFFILCIVRWSKEFTLFALIILFYAVYSHFFSANPLKNAQYLDLLQQIKPYCVFYFFYKFPMVFSCQKKSALKILCAGSMLVLVFSYWSYGMYGLGLIEHPFVLGICAFSFATLYYYFSDCKKIDLIVIAVILGLGLLSLRAKYFGEFLLFFASFFFVKGRIKVNVKYIVASCIVLVAGFYLVASKFTFYFVQSSGAARYLLYTTMPLVLKDYFPFGSGLASYATYASGEYYSPLYYKYGISNGYGMSEHNFSYISDTYFPVLAQFGVVGIILFFFFWKKRCEEISSFAETNIHFYRIGLLIVAMVMIESVAGPVLVMSWNFIPMAILGSICSQGCDLKNEEIVKHI